MSNSRAASRLSNSKAGEPRSSSRLGTANSTSFNATHTSLPPIDQSESMRIADYLDPSRPLVRSKKPLTKPKGPSFTEGRTVDERRYDRAETKVAASNQTAELNRQRENERKYLKAQYEFEREKKLAERSIYQKERNQLWSQRLASSPLAVDLVADYERIEEENFIRQKEEKRRQALAERKKRKIKNEIIVKALAEVPLLEEARRQKREMIEDERRQKALRDVQRVEAIQDRKRNDLQAVNGSRQERIEQRRSPSAR